MQVKACKVKKFMPFSAQAPGVCPSGGCKEQESGSFKTSIKTASYSDARNSKGRSGDCALKKKAFEVLRFSRQIGGDMDCQRQPSLIASWKQLLRASKPGAGAAEKKVCKGSVCVGAVRTRVRVCACARGRVRAVCACVCRLRA